MSAEALSGIPLRFVKYYEKASTVLGGDQIAEALASRGLDARSIAAEALGGERGALLVFVKTSRLDHLVGARRRGCRAVIDVHDTVVFKGRIKNALLYDGAIFRNRRQLEDFGRRRWVSRVIPFQGDPRFGPHAVPEGEFRAAYLGDRRSMRLFGRLPGVEFVEDDFFARAREYNCHLSVREPGREELYKPGAKIAVAAACRAVLVTTRDVAAVERLGAEYPFYCEAEEASIVAALERARAAVGGPEWEAARSRLEVVRERTTLDRVADDYVELFSALARRSGDLGRGSRGARIGVREGQP